MIMFICRFFFSVWLAYLFRFVPFRLFCLLIFNCVVKIIMIILYNYILVLSFLMTVCIRISLWFFLLILLIIQHTNPLLTFFYSNLSTLIKVKLINQPIIGIDIYFGKYFYILFNRFCPTFCIVYHLNNSREKKSWL